MLEYMRKHSQSYLIYVFFGIIIVVFIFFFGPQSRGCGPPGSMVVASVGSEEISSRQMDQLFMRTSNWESRIPADQRLDPAMRRRLLAEDLVLVLLLAEQAREAGLAVSDTQLSTYVRDPQRNVDFGEYRDRDGNFSMEQFELRVPGAFGLALTQYEAWKESELLASEYLGMLAAAVPVTQGELDAVYRPRHTRYKLEYIRFDPTELAPLFATTDEQVADLLARQPERVQEYYQSHLDTYQQERQLRVERILIQLPGDDDPQGQALARQRFDTSLALLQDNPDSFQEVAGEFSQATEAANGGDMGLHPESYYSSYPFLAGRLDEIEPGAIQTYEMSQALVIFRIREAVPALTPPYEEIAAEVARDLLESEQEEQPIRTLAEQCLARAQEGLTLQDIAEEFNEAQLPAATDNPQEAARPLLQAQQTDLFALDTPGFDLSILGPEYANQPRLPGDPENIPGLGRLPRLARQLTRMTSDNPVAPEVYTDGQVHYVARLIQVELPPDPPDPEALEEIRNEIWREKVRSIFGDWQARLLLHQPTSLSPFLSELLEQAISQGLIKLNESYFATHQAP
ncbi:MAG: SurA N-terminal domain-containing protein [Bradymonadales bacterium]|nr:SurA N-terminal domain-containing protein [Bradymonadales bacterium]